MLVPLKHVNLFQSDHYGISGNICIASAQNRQAAVVRPRRSIRESNADLLEAWL